MKYVNSHGVTGSIKVGDTPPPNIGFAHISLSYEDIANIYFLPWFISHVLVRFVNSSITH